MASRQPPRVPRARADDPRRRGRIGGGGLATNRIAVVSPTNADRLARASSWLADRAPAEEVLVLAASTPAAHELLRGAAVERGAAFGWHRSTLTRLAGDLAADALAARDRVGVGRLPCAAVVARAVQQLAQEGALGRYAAVADGPTFARAAAAALEELRLARVDPASLEPVDAGLAAVFRRYDEGLAQAGLIDRAGVLDLATAAARDRDFEHPLLGLPTLLLDVPLETEAEIEFADALCERAMEVMATAPAGDERTSAALVDRLGMKLEVAGARDSAAASEDPAPVSLRKLQHHLFEDRAPEPAALSDDVVVLSAPGESRECVEIARRLLGYASRGVPFDRMAVLLRSAAEYRPHLEEALHRAGIPAHFAAGAVRPDPAGRAFLALLACRADEYSARRFAEYLSLGEVPDADAAGGPPAEREPGDRWVAPDEEMVPAAIADALEAARTPGTDGRSARADPDGAPVTDGTLRAPRRWEKLLVEAAVIGGRARWERRLDGLAQAYRLELRELEGTSEPRIASRERDLAALESLRAYALPVLDALADLPSAASGARWGDWLDALSGLATRTLRRPDRVLSVLALFAPMAEVGPVTLRQVIHALAERLQELAEPPATSRQGRVFVAPTEAARGLAFDVVAVPGLAERLFPRKIAEEPLLLDAQRERLGRGLTTNEARVERERLALRIAVGAARRVLLLSYPRLDLDQSRPRVPSFYALEALRAAEGALPGFDELAARAERVAAARVGWPAPAEPEEAIDCAEHDLALLERLLSRAEEQSVGAARYLLTANEHLGRALRFRARRWLPSWTEADGLMPGATGEVPASAREAIEGYRLAERAYAVTTLEHFSACPYRFLLRGVHRLSEREVPEEIDEIDPRQRGSLVHDVQFELYSRLDRDGLLPVTDASLAQGLEALDAVLDEVAARYRDDLVPAIDRVWDDGVAAVRADLRQWLRLSAHDASGFRPWRFELSFGRRGRAELDPHSVDEPVALDCGLRLRGSIDLVERRADGALRVTDHKTGKQTVEPGEVISGGAALQPVLYALAAEKLVPEAEVLSGRLYYCTSTGRYQEVDVPLDAQARKSAKLVAEVIDEALAEPFLPAAPCEGACQWCDYKIVCGPYEELRTRRKWQGHPQLASLRKLREAR